VSTASSRAGLPASLEDVIVMPVPTDEPALAERAPDVARFGDAPYRSEVDLP
jgi:hypothetical protein